MSKHQVTRATMFTSVNSTILLILILNQTKKSFVTVDSDFGDCLFRSL